MGRKHLFAGASVALVLVACSLTPTTSTDDTQLSQADVDAIANMMFVDLKSNDVSGVSTQSLHVDAPCSPQHLTPPQACASGGNIYTTINMTCPDANAAQCCAAKPACAKWTTGFSGQSKTLYNSCKPSPRVSFDGTLNGTLSARIESGCAGSPAIDMTYNVNGSLSVRVDGHDACPEGFFLTFHAYYYASWIWALTGTICGRQVFVSDKTQPAVQCSGFGCPSGTFCGKCNQACWQTGWDDCCDGACPPGTHCVSGGKCQ